MRAEDLKKLVEAKKQTTEPLETSELQAGFKGWYASKYLPHFDSSGTFQYVTFRLADSLPLKRKGEWEALLRIEEDLERQRKLEKYLDLGFGACHLRDSRLATAVQESIWHGDGNRYRLKAWVIMPNHVHLLVEMWDMPLGRIVKGWKSFSCRQAKHLGFQVEHGLWEEDFFDRYIRDREHFNRVVRYIENNPVKANLVTFAKDWPWSSAHFRREEERGERTLTHPTAEKGSEA